MTFKKLKKKNLGKLDIFSYIIYNKIILLHYAESVENINCLCLTYKNARYEIRYLALVR